MGGTSRLGSQTTVLALLLLAVFCAVAVRTPSAATGRLPPPPIIEGEPAEAGQYAAHGYLQVRLPTGRSKSCGGTLVGTRHFLTAAHCAVSDSNAPLSADNFAILLGDVDLTPPNVDWYGVTSVDIHPGFDDELRNDVALLKLDKPALGYAPLPVVGTDQASLWAPGVTARIIGWGMTESGSTSSVLLEADVPIVGDAACAGAYASLFDAGTMVCAGDGVHDTCQGDSGGPLMAWDGRVFALVGITSWGFACAYPGYPGVYTRLGASGLNSWVHQRIPRASFTFALEPGAGASLRFTSTSFHPEVGGFTSFNWDFDDDGRGRFDEGTGESVVHTFPAEGIYEVNLEASKAGGDRAVVTRRVNTNGQPAPPLPPTPPPPPAPPRPRSQPPSCPPGDVPPGATYRGSHSGGGNFCLTVAADFSGVTGFVAYDVAGNACRFDWSQNNYAPPLPIVSRSFSQSGNANLAGYFTTDRLGRSVASGSFSLFSAGFRPCFSGFLSWTATTDAATPWVAPAPPPHPRLAPKAQVRCRVPNVIGRRLPAARSRIRARSCRIGKVVRKRSKKVGRVIGQKPRAGAVRGRNFRVSLTVGRR